MNDKDIEKKLLEKLKNMPEYRMDSSVKNQILNNIEKLGETASKKHKRVNKAGKLIGGAAGCALAAAVAICVLSPGLRQSLYRFLPGYNVTQHDTGDKAIENPPEQNYTPLPQVKFSPDLTSIHITSDNTGWSLSSDSIFHTNDGGATWDDVTPVKPTASVNWNAFFLDENYGWAASSESLDSYLTIYRTSDGGKSWNNTVSLEKGYPDIQFIDEKSGWILLHQGIAMHSEGISIIKTADGGATWTVASTTDPQNSGTSGKPPFGGDKTGFFFSSKLKGWITGYIPMEGYTYLYASYDGGFTWKEESLKIPDGLMKHEATTLTPFFLNSNDGILPVRFFAEDEKYVFYTTHNGGASWEAGTPLASTPGEQLLWSFVNINTGFCTDGKKFYKTSDGGRTWKSISSNIGLYNISEISFISAEKGWAVVDGTVFKTEDGSLTWHNVDGSPGRTPGIFESRLGIDLPYASDVPVKPGEKLEDTFKSLLSKYLEHYSDENIPDIERLKYYRINDIKIVQSNDKSFTFYTDFMLQGATEETVWARGDSASQGGGLVENKILYITVEKQDNVYKMKSISAAPPVD